MVAGNAEVENVVRLASESRVHTKAGLVLVIEGMEGVGKTTSCALLHSAATHAGLRSALLVDHYERSGRTGPLIAAITENPVVKLETDQTLFFLYCARLSDKSSLARRLAQENDLVVVDRLDLSLLARAVAGWRLPVASVRETLRWARCPLDSVRWVTVCLDADEKISRARSVGKPPRRRSFLPLSVVSSVHCRLLEEAQQTRIEIIDTSMRSPEEVLAAIDKVCARELGGSRG